MTHLYIATRSDAPDIVKIGRSNDPCRRCEGLSSSHCFTVSPTFVFHGYGRLEAAVHKALEDKRVLGGTGEEWFRVSARHPQRRPTPAKHPSATVVVLEVLPDAQLMTTRNLMATHPSASC